MPSALAAAAGSRAVAGHRSKRDKTSKKKKKKKPHFKDHTDARAAYDAVAEKRRELEAIMSLKPRPDSEEVAQARAAAAPAPVTLEALEMVYGDGVPAPKRVRCDGSGGLYSCKAGERYSCSGRVNRVFCNLRCVASWARVLGPP
jgi:hypothetical protein